MPIGRQCAKIQKNIDFNAIGNQKAFPTVI